MSEDPNIYLEKHHITPRFAGGTDDLNNIVFLTYNDHVIAHYIRWIVYNEEGDRVAWQVMSGQSVDIRRETARLAGRIGGVNVQQQHRQRGTGWFNSQGQRERGQRGAAVNREQGTGAFDPRNLERANNVLNENPELYRQQRLENLQKGRETQKRLGINLGNRESQRLKSLKRVGYIELNGSAVCFLLTESIKNKYNLYSTP